MSVDIIDIQRAPKNVRPAHILRRTTLVGKALSFTHELHLFISFLSIHRAQHPLSEKSKEK